MSRRDGKSPGVQEAFEGMRSDYSAAKSSRYKRRRTGYLLTGSSGDYHYRNVFDYLRIMEYARDMDRNDSIVGQMIDRAVLNTVQDGLTPDPKTPDLELNKALKARFEDWAEDPGQCDVAAGMTFTDQQELVLRHMLVDGDIFSLPLDTGQLQLVEAHRLRTPTGTKRNVICGILLDDLRKPVEYWICKDDVDPFKPLTLVGDVEKIGAFDADGNPQVHHIKNPKRVTQTRGMSALAPVFDFLGMHEDLQFAKLVQQQVASCIAIVRNREANWKPGGIDPYGAQGTEMWDSAKRLVEDIAPGMELRGLPGEKIEGFSPNVPNAEFFQQMRTILQIIGINLGLPLVLLLMDASDTNFSGWRGAVDQARMGFRRNQRALIDHFHTPVYRWKLRQFSAEDRGFRTALAKHGKHFFDHQWNAPRWPYIQPLQDAQADQLRQQSLLASPRRIHHERNQEWNEIIDESIEDNGSAIEKAITKAKAIAENTGEKITWREVLFLTDPKMYQAATQSATLASAPTTPPAGPLGLNGAQITAAVDIVGKLHSGSLASVAATELLTAVGLDPKKAAAVVKATPTTGGGDEDKQYARELLKAFAANPNVLPLVVNGTSVAGIIKLSGTPQNVEYDEPYLPILAPPGMPVSGDVLKDPQGAIVGGATVGSPAPTLARDGGDHSGKETGDAGDPAATPDKKEQENA